MVRQTIRRSRFVTYLGHAPDEVAAKAFLDQVRAEHPGATHHCWAFNAGAPGTTAHVGMSDDGEPHGTAGRPMLNALLHSGVGEVVAVCVRYYGGAKLGTGGLVRAYTTGVVGALEQATLVEKVERVSYRLTVAYDAVQAVKRVLEGGECLIVDQEFGTEAVFQVLVPAAAVDDVAKAVADATRGGGRMVLS